MMIDDDNYDYDGNCDDDDGNDDDAGNNLVCLSGFQSKPHDDQARHCQHYH